MVVAAHTWNGAPPHGDRLLPSTSNFAGGGWLGVQLFFVLSGYLITSILLAELAAADRVDFREFYARRFRRLLPALYLTVGSYLVFALAARRGDGLVHAVGSVVRAVFYVENLDPIINGRIPTDGYLEHTWSLATEEQFYLVWPVVLVWSIRRWARRGAAIVALLVIAATIVGRWALVARGVHPYEEMHWDALMAGCLLAIHPVKPGKWLGWAALGATAVLNVHMPEGVLGSWTFVVTAALGAAIVCTATTMGWLASPIMRYFGRISYGMYLWHTLLIRFGWNPWLTLVVSVGLADGSYRLVEQRFLRPRRVRTLVRA